MSSVPTVAPIFVSGIGVITGKPVEVQIIPGEPGTGIVFYLDGKFPLPARLASVMNMDRGVTLANTDGRTLSIVEHFLCAASLAGLNDLKVAVTGAPEMPILDGSAQDWLKVFARHFEIRLPKPTVSLQQAVFYRHNDDVAVYSVPHPHFKVSYSVDFNHPELRNRWVCWDSQKDNPALISTACTFGYISELPALQARGLAMGANLENSLGLKEEGGYSRPLRHEDEPIYHKILDLIGDLRLTGINPLSVKAHVFALNAGHSSHIPFASQLLKALYQSPS